MKCMKRGQITVYIIVGIVLLLSFAFFVRIVSTQQQLKPVDAGTGGQSSVFYVRECLKVSGEDAVREIGLQGGDLYLKFPRLSMPDGRQATYLYQEGFSYLPEKEDLERQLGSYAGVSVRDCVYRDVLPDAEPLSVEATIADESVYFSLLESVDVGSGNAASPKEGLTVQVPVGLGKAYKAAVEVADAIRNSDARPDTKLENALQPHIPASPEFSLDFAYSALDVPEGVSVTYEFYNPSTTLWLISYEGYNFVFAAQHMRRQI